MLGLAGYLVISVSAAFHLNGWTTHPVKELFPFFSWSLFSDVKNERIEYSIVIHQLDDETFAEPLDLREASGLPAFGGSRSLSYKALQNVGSALRSKDEGSMADLEVFETQYFSGHDLDYEIIRKTFDPIRRWHDQNDFLKRESVGRYEYRGRST